MGTYGISKVDHSQPRSVYFGTVDCRMHVCFHILSMIPSKCFSQFFWFDAPSSSPNTLHYDLPVDVSIQCIWGSWCICILAWLSCPSAYLCSPNRHFQRYLILCSQWPPAASPNVLCHDTLLDRYMDIKIRVQTQNITIENHLMSSSKYDLKVF
jgi:hypothetical protein